MGWCVPVSGFLLSGAFESGYGCGAHRVLRVSVLRGVLVRRIVSWSHGSPNS